MQILLVDHYDSFTNNMVSLLKQISKKIQLKKILYSDVTNDLNLNFDLLFLFAGPGHPQDYPKSHTLVEKFDNVLGICLGMQIITMVTGGKCIQSKFPIHGMQIPIFHKKQFFLKNLPSPFYCARYNSLVCIPDKKKLILASDQKNAPMIIYEKKNEKNYIGIQFHPESFLSYPHGPILMSNILHMFAKKCSKFI